MTKVKVRLSPPEGAEVDLENGDRRRIKYRVTAMIEFNRRKTVEVG